MLLCNQKFHQLTLTANQRPESLTSRHPHTVFINDFTNKKENQVRRPGPTDEWGMCHTSFTPKA